MLSLYFHKLPTGFFKIAFFLGWFFFFLTFCSEAGLFFTATLLMLRGIGRQGSEAGQLRYKKLKKKNAKKALFLTPFPLFAPSRRVGFFKKFASLHFLNIFFLFYLFFCLFFYGCVARSASQP
jgi:hypothetical protein